MNCRGLRTLPSKFSVDSFHIECPLQWHLFAFCVQDGNKFVFTMAIWVLDQEDYDNWAFFLSQLKAAIGNASQDIIIMSDGKKYLIDDIRNVFRSTQMSFIWRILLKIYFRLSGIKSEFNSIWKLLHWLLAPKNSRIMWENFAVLIPQPNDICAIEAQECRPILISLSKGRAFWH